MTRQIQTMAHVTVSVFTMEENKIFEPVRMFLFFVWELFCCFKFITNFQSIFKNDAHISAISHLLNFSDLFKEAKPVQSDAKIYVDMDHLLCLVKI